MAKRNYLCEDVQSGTGTEYASAQIINPVASGMVILIKEVIAMTDLATTALRLKKYATILTGTGLSTSFSNNTDQGGAATSATLRRSAAPAMVGTTFIRRLVNANYQQLGNFLFFHPDSWIRLDEGEGLLIQDESVNGTMTFAFHYSEID